MTSPQISAVTLGARDLQTAKEFYEHCLGCTVHQDYPASITLELGERSSTLALAPWGLLAEDAGVPPAGSGFRAFTLSYIVEDAAGVDAVLANASRARGKVVKRARAAFWGGYSGNVADPDGHVWKIASNSRARRGSRGVQPSEPIGPKETALTLGVGDIKRIKRFYRDDLNCEIDKDYRRFVSFDLGRRSSAFGLYRRDALAKESGVDSAGKGFRGFVISCVVMLQAQVDEILERARMGGARIVRAAEVAPWGGYSGHFADPDGNLWKVATH